MNKSPRTGIGYAPTAPSGLLEHSHSGIQMEKAFQNPFFNTLIDQFIAFSTNDRMLHLITHAARTRFRKVFVKIIDLLCTHLDKRFFSDPNRAKAAFLGKIPGSSYRSVFGGYFSELIQKYLRDWTYFQSTKIPLSPPVRKFHPVKKTFLGWKQLRERIQPGWQVFPPNPETPIKILPSDTLTPRARIERIIHGKIPDRVGLGLSWDWGIPLMGGSNMWKFCYDGIETGWASLNVWIRTGGSDFLPISFGAAAYTVPFPDTHSRFFFDWSYPTDNTPPQMHERELLKNYTDLYNYGMCGLAQQITKRMIRDVLLLVREFFYFNKVIKHYFGPYEHQFFPNPTLLFATWDILPMWRSLIPFIRDMRKNPNAVREAFEFLNRPLTDFMLHVGKLLNAKVALIGNSRGSNSFISPTMFEDLFWPSMKYTFNQCFKHNIIPLCHLDNDWTENMAIFAEYLPKRSCIFHLDQVDLVKVHDLIGDHFCLMGGLSPSLLVHGTPSQVEAAATRYITSIGSDGLILSSGCEIPFDIPIQNIYALKQAILKHGIF